jgi:anti-sigma B factor antagonist
VEFKLATADLGNGTYSIVVSGEATIVTAPQLKTALAEVAGAGARGVLVDFSETTFIDSTALGVLMNATKWLRPVGGELVIVCGAPSIRRIFELTLLDRIFDIFETQQAGISHLQGLRRHAPVV